MGTSNGWETKYEIRMATCPRCQQTVLLIQGRLVKHTRKVDGAVPTKTNVVCE